MVLHILRLLAAQLRQLVKKEATNKSIKKWMNITLKYAWRNQAWKQKKAISTRAWVILYLPQIK